MAILRLGAVRCLWKRRLAKLNTNNPRPLVVQSDIAVSSGRLLALLALAAVVRPGHRVETSPRYRLIEGVANSVRALSDPSQGLLDGP